jgi:hypothetical protein
MTASKYYEVPLDNPETYPLSNSDINDILIDPRKWVLNKLNGTRKNTSDAAKKGQDLHALVFDEYKFGDFILTPNGNQQFRMEDPEWIRYTISPHYNPEIWEEKKINVELKKDSVYLNGKHIIPKEMPRFSISEYINACQLKMEIFNEGFAEKEFYAHIEGFGNLRGKIDYYKIKDDTVNIIDLKTKMSISFDDIIKYDRKMKIAKGGIQTSGVELILKEKIENYALQMFIYKSLMKANYPEKNIKFSFCFLICSKDEDELAASNKYFVDNVFLSTETENLCKIKIQLARKFIIEQYNFIKNNPDFSMENIGYIESFEI